MRPPSPLLILLYITLSKSVKMVSKRGSGIYPSLITAKSGIKKNKTKQNLYVYMLDNAFCVYI